MLDSGGPFVGRKDELARAEAATELVRSGGGALLLFSGEAGLGKTRIVQTIANRAAAKGTRVVWGRAWEAGGAPPYWLWLQVFRALGAQDDPFAVGDHSEQELPQARFASFDKAARWLKQEASRAPVALVLDDLHAADVSSLLFLQFLSRDLVGSRLLVLCTYRDVEARLSLDVGILLAKIAREGEAFALGRLSREEVCAWISAVSCRPVDSITDEAERIYRVTEGNPLFIHELLRVRGASIAEATMALGLRAILEQHLARVSAETRTVLEIGSVLGRDLDPALIVAISGFSFDQVHRALHEARDAGLVASITGALRLSFSHILFRESLYAQLAPSRCAWLHSAAGEEILATGGDATTATHHLLAGDSAPTRVAHVAREAARIALKRLALEDASAICERALAKHRADDEVTFDLELLLGESLIRTGRTTAGQASCASAVTRAKRMGSPTCQAQAALTYALDLVTASRDATMSELLRDALDTLPAEDSPIRARTLARYAASLAPARSPDEAAVAVQNGEAAIEMARRSGDADTLLYALHYGCSAMGYQIPARKRHDLRSEMIATAEALGRPIAMLDLGGWWVASLREHRTLSEADAALASYERLVQEFPQPYYRWRIPMLRATHAGLAGDFAAADRLCADALKIADDGEIHGGKVAWALCRLSLAQLRGEPARIASDKDVIEAVTSRFTGGLALTAWVCAATGRPEEARRLLADAGKWAGSYPLCLLAGVAITMLGDAEFAARLYPALMAHAGGNTFYWGPFGSSVFGPTPRIAGDLARLLGRSEEARQLYDEAIAIGERATAPALIALAKRGRTALDGKEETTASSNEAFPPALAASASMLPSATAVVGRVDLAREGEMWRIITSTGTPLYLKDSKGLHYLAELVSCPGRELHVTQLVELCDVPDDTGPVLDGLAKRQYRERLESLRDQLEEARRFGDLTRADHAEAEMDALAEQLARAVGLGGRDRKLGSHVERLRINVQRRLRDAIQRIEQQDPPLGRYLSATIKTGAFCTFLPI